MSSALFDVPGPRASRRYRVISAVTVLALLALLAAVVVKLASEDQFTAQKWEPFVTPSIMQLLLEGLIDTLAAAAYAVLFAVLFGLIFATGKLSDHAWIRWPAWGVVELFRAVPLLLLIFALFFLYSPPLTSFWCLVIGLTLYNGSVLAEVFRAGINAVPKGQSEAAYAIGLRKTQVTTIVLLPQASRIMLPSIISQCIVVLKDTSLGFAIIAPGLTSAGREIWNTFQNKFATALVLAAIYILLNLALSWLATRVQRRLAAGYSGGGLNVGTDQPGAMSGAISRDQSSAMSGD
jgi:glutamate transport system permease protein